MLQSCLAAANWDMDAAMEALRLKGLAAAVKKASRHASEGLVAVAQVRLHANKHIEAVHITSQQAVHELNPLCNMSWPGQTHSRLGRQLWW
jgi:translation elongation factor EF-Ts